jgi:hypothetical protein
MGSDRFLPYHLLSAIVFFSLTTTVMAGWGFGGAASSVGRSGLDLEEGYDQNTVTTVTGKVIGIPAEPGPQQFLLDLGDGSEPLHLVVGPVSYWKEKGIDIRPGEQLSATGAKAQGKDGATYLLVSQLINRSSSQEIRLRSSDGKPYWSGSQRTSSQPHASTPRTFTPGRYHGGRMGR